ncbi:MAG: EpsG family protein [Firmicutes bacterium]|nr:EpsG family protein [Bacillota bacterium]
MTIYLIVIAFWGFISLFVSQNSRISLRQKRNIYIYIAGGSLLFLMGLRDVTVGTDVMSYYNEFLNPEQYLQFRTSERGYSYFNLFFSKSGIGFQLYLFIIASFIVIVISKLYKKYSKNIILSFYLFVTLGLFAMTMSGIRQSLAVTISIIAFMFLMNNKKLLFICLVILATFFHNSAIIFLVVYLVKDFEMKKFKAIILYVISLTSYFALSILIPLVTNIIPERYLERYLHLEVNINPLVIVVYLLIPLAVLIIWKPTIKPNLSDSLISKLLLLSFFSVVIYFFATEISLFERLIYYFMVFTTILIPNVIMDIKNKHLKTASIVACIILPLIMFLITTQGGSLGIDNYKFFWK